MDDPLIQLCKNGDLIKIKKLIKKYKTKRKWKIAQLERKIQKNEDELEYEYCTDWVNQINDLERYKAKFQKRIDWALHNSFSLKNFEEKINNKVVKYLLTENAHFDKKWNVPKFGRIGPLEWCIVTNNTENKLDV